jgi:hypothetical protein
MQLQTSYAAHWQLRKHATQHKYVSIRMLPDFRKSITFVGGGVQVPPVRPVTGCFEGARRCVFSTGAIHWQGKTVSSEGSVPMALCPPQIPRAVARNRTWNAAVRYRPDDSCSHVAVRTMRCRYEYQPLNNQCEQVSGLLTAGLFNDTYWQRVRLHDKSTGKNVEEPAVANAVLLPGICIYGLQKKTPHNSRCSDQIPNRTFME